MQHEVGLSTAQLTGAFSVALLISAVAGIAGSYLDRHSPRALMTARELTRQRPGLRLLMLSMHDAELYCLQALKAGACGYVLKSAAERDLVEACRAAMRGEAFLYPPTRACAPASMARGSSAGSGQRADRA
jgi:DNA-binding NarL/FixJ family response regulator